MDHSTGSTFFFPLRSNIGYFDEIDGYLSLIDRIKQASLLYDHLFFEAGVYDSVVYEQGVYEFWHPPVNIDIEELEHDRLAHQPTGGESALYVQLPGQSEMFSLVSGPVVRRLRSEFHTTLYKIHSDHIPWIHVEPLELTKEGEDIVKNMQGEFRDYITSTQPDTNKWLAGKIAFNLGRDLLISSDMRSSASINSSFAPIVATKARYSPAPLLTALEVSVPNFTELSWEDIDIIRNLPSLVEFRKKMYEIELSARLGADIHNEEGEYSLKYRLLQAFNKELTKELREYQPKTAETVGNIGIDIAFELIGQMIPGAGLIRSALTESVKWASAERSWITAFLRMQGPTE